MSHLIMSPPASPSQPELSGDENESKKKGSRGGKRSVSHLSSAQLARKRANDREAQRNIRQRTKEHIETLEARVRVLEGADPDPTLDQVLRQNQDLLAEVAKLRTQLAQLAQQQQPPPQQPASLQGPSLLPPTIPAVTPYRPAVGPSSRRHLVAPVIPLKPEPVSPSKLYPPASFSPDTAFMGFVEGEEPDETSGVGPTIPLPATWDDDAAPMVVNPDAYTNKYTSGWSAPPPVTTSYQPPMVASSRLYGMQPSSLPQMDPAGAAQFRGMSDVPMLNPTHTTCWQAQPSVYAWQMTTKLKAPFTYIDKLMVNIIHAQRHLAITEDLSGEALVGPSFPSVDQLFNPVEPPNTPPRTLAEVMDQYSAVLSTRGFALIPEKLASFMCMYRFVQWQISPTHETFKALHDWQAPHQSQITIPHPAWMDLPPWPAFRAKIIENQARYDNPEFQHDYASNLNVNFPFDPLKAVLLENGQLKVSYLLDRHLSNINNMTMKKAFIDKYPEFVGTCGHLER